jgi:HlyD family secretion protein
MALELEADVDAAKAVEKDAKRTYERNAELRKSNAVSQQDLDDALAAYESAKAHAVAFQAELDLVIAGPRKEDIAEAKALLKRYEAELAQTEHDLKDAYLYAPSDGVVQNRILEVGDMASPQKTVYTVALTDPVWVRAYVSEPDLGKIFAGMKASVVTDSFPDKEYEGWIGFISPTAEFTPKPVETRELRTKLVYQIRVFVKNPNNELRLGMPATVKIRLGQPSVGEKTSQPKTGAPDARDKTLTDVVD